MKFFTLRGGTYAHDAYVLITSDIGKAVKKINRHWKLPDNHRKLFTEEDFNFRGRVFIHPELCPVIWIPRIPITPQEHATLSHEVFHVVCIIMRWAGIVLCEESEEAYAHQFRYLEEQIYSKMKKKI